jgi:hypothetical protein
MREYGEAIDFLEQALDILNPMLGYDHPHTKLFGENLQIAKSKLI